VADRQTLPGHGGATAGCADIDPCSPCTCERLSAPSDEGYARIMLRGSTALKTAAGMMNRQDRRAVPALLNVRGLPYVLPHSMPPIGEESDEQTRAYRMNQMNAEEAGPARGAAGRYDPKRSSLRTWMFARP
jgi:hypothetical protein